MMREVKGFTLIEILVAVMLLAMVGAALVGSFNSTINVKDRVDTISNRFHLSRQAMERMANEISMAYISAQANQQLPVTETRFKGEKDKIAFDAFGQRPVLKNAKESDQREISFYLDQQGGATQPALMRKIRHSISLHLGDDGAADILCPDVKSLSFKYWDPINQVWNDSFEAKVFTPFQNLPPRVQIEMVVAIDKDVEQKFVTQTEIWLTKPINIK